MKQLDIWFTDFNPDMPLEKCPEYNFLKKLFTLNLNPDNPDFVIASVFGTGHLKYDRSVKILISGENVSPDFNMFDYAVTSDPLTFGDRHLRVPYWALRNLNMESYESVRRPVADKDPFQRKFCNFVYSNSSNYCAMPARNELFNTLSRYRHIDSGGSCLNNMGGVKVADKMDFISHYKFTIACENSIKPGYSTEKIIEPLIANSIPIYYGDPEIASELNPKAFINVAEFPSAESLLEHIRKIDTDRDLYLDMLSQPIFNTDRNLIDEYTAAYRAYLLHILNRPPQQALRRCRYGWSKITIDTHLGLCRSLADRIRTAITLRLPFLRHLTAK